MNAGDFIGARALYSVALSSNVETSYAIPTTMNSIIAAAAKFLMSCGAFEHADALTAKLIENSANVNPIVMLDESNSFYSVAEALEHMGRTKEAELIYTNLKAAYSTAPKNTYLRKESVKQYCRFLVRQNRYTELPPHLRFVETMDDDLSLQDLEFLGDTEYAIGRFKQAALWYEQSATKYETTSYQTHRQLENDKPLIKTLFKAADAYYAGQDYHSASNANSEALIKYKAAIPKDMELTFEKSREFSHPAMSQLLVQEGDIRLALKRNEEANQSYEMALHLAKAALFDDNIWLREIYARLHESKGTLAAREIDVSSVTKPTSWHKIELPTAREIETYSAFKAKSANRLDLAKEFLSSMQSNSVLNNYDFAKFFSLIEIEKLNSEKGALDLLHQLQEQIAVKNVFHRLSLSVFEEWLSRQQNSRISFENTCSILIELAPDVKGRLAKGEVAVFEKLRWLALEWRLAGYPELAKELLNKAEEIREREDAIINDYQKMLSISMFDLRAKEDLCLSLIDLALYSEAESVALNPIILNSAHKSFAKWHQICDSFEAADQWSASEKVLLALANAPPSDKNTDSPYAKAQILFRLAKLYLETDQLSKAEEFSIASINAGVSSDPWSAYAVLAQSLDKQNKLEAAIQNYLKAASEDPRYGNDSMESRDRRQSYLRRALAIQEKLYGRSHPRLIETLVQLTYAIQRCGNTADVPELTERINCLQQELSSLSPEEELKFWSQMVLNYRVCKEFEKEIDAQTNVARLAEKCKSNWGWDYESLANMQLAHLRINEAVSNIKKYIDSPAFLRQLWEGGSSIGGDSDRFTEGLIRAGHASAAIRVLQFAQAVATNKYGKYAMFVINFAAAIAKAQAMSHDYLACDKTCKQMMQVLEESRFNDPFADRIGVGSEKPTKSLIEVASELSEHKQYEQALALLERILALQGKFLGKNSLEIASTQSAIAALLLEQSKFKEAKSHAWNAIDIYETNYGRGWHAMGHYVTTYLNILRALQLEDEITVLKSNYKEFDVTVIDTSRRNSDIVFFRVEMEKLKEGRALLLNAAREEEIVSGANSKESRDILAKLIELESHAQNYELVLDLKKRSLETLSLVNSAEGVESRKQMKEIADIYQKLGQMEESARLIGKIVSILEQIPEDARSQSDKFDLIHFYVLQGEKAKATNLLSKLSEQYKARNEDSTAIRQCASYFAQLGDAKESESLKELANLISNKQHEEYLKQMEKQRAKQ